MQCFSSFPCLPFKQVNVDWAKLDLIKSTINFLTETLENIFDFVFWNPKISHFDSLDDFGGEKGNSGKKRTIPMKIEQFRRTLQKPYRSIVIITVLGWVKTVVVVVPFHKNTKECKREIHKIWGIIGDEEDDEVSTHEHKVTLKDELPCEMPWTSCLHLYCSWDLTNFSFIRQINYLPMTKNY